MFQDYHGGQELLAVRLLIENLNPADRNSEKLLLQLGGKLVRNKRALADPKQALIQVFQDLEDEKRDTEDTN
jgi:hypothetical protein